MSLGVKPHRERSTPTRASYATEPARPPHDAERACAFVIDKVRASAGALFHQGARVPPLIVYPEAPLVRFVAEQRMYRISTEVARALVAWGNGFPVELRTDVPSVRTVLALQAVGRRCVSLLPEGVATAPHADALAFAIHDLCHLDKFIDAEHHRGQVGFFACLLQAVEDPAFAEFEGRFDAIFSRDWHYVAADMNGSAVFLFAALKMKLKMASRRRVAAAEGVPPNHNGPLTPSETRSYATFLEDLLHLLRLRGEVADAARRTSARRDDPAAALTLLRHFEAIGDAVLRRPHVSTRQTSPQTPLRAS